MNLSMRTQLFAAAVITLSVANPLQANQVIFEQLPSSLPAPGLSSRVGFDNRPDGLRTADDFVLPAQSLISEIRWWGGCHSQAPPGSCALGGVDQFTFAFYSSTAGLPGALLLETTGTLLENTHGASYAARLNTPFLADAGTTYWLSIFNEALHEPWGWTNSQSGNNHSAHADGPAFAIWNPTAGFDVDSAFQLVVPEPATMWLAASLLLSVLPRWNRLVISA